MPPDEKRRSWHGRATPRCEATPHWPERAALLRFVLDRQAGHEGAREVVRALIPAHLRPTDEFQAGRWLSLLDAARITPLEAPPDGSFAWRTWKAAQETWRPDVKALQTKRLLILSPFEDARRAAVGLALGEMVCRQLETLFGVTSNQEPVTVQLFESRDEYVAASKKSGHVMAGEWGGYYDPQLQLVRAYLPEGERADATLLSTLAHEITHHWVQEHLGKGPLRRDPSLVPGFFVSEGVAELMAEMRFDLRDQLVVPFDKRASSLDVVASIDPRALIPWDALLRMPQRLYAALDNRQTIPVRTRWRLAARRELTRFSLFYDQAAAACHYLLHAVPGGEKRLCDLLRAHYDGTLDQKKLAQLLGADPKAFGQQVVAFAKQVQEGSFTPK